MRRCVLALIVAALPGCRTLLGIEEPLIATDAGRNIDDSLPGDGLLDAAVDSGFDAANCFGELHRFCFGSRPTGALLIEEASVMIDTTSALECTFMPLGPGLPTACVIARESIAISSGSLLLARGANPLVLLAVSSLTINGTVDVSSTLGATGAGGNPASCLTAGSGSVFGGGAGGTLGTRGGAGGGSGAGLPAAASNIATLRGGCSGGSGGNGGSGGSGGGAVLLIGASITINGTINASGAGGTGGTAIVSSAGGGGGGSGGMIVLDIAFLALPMTSVLIANGGGGGEGAVAPMQGTRGSEASVLAPQTAAAGGAGAGGGDGGAGSTIGEGVVGSAGSASDVGSGGGGGGAGAIRFTSQNAGSTGIVIPAAGTI